MPGKAARQKGDRTERLAVDILKSYGLEARRIPLSGAMEGFKGDFECHIGKQKLIAECKCRGTGFATLYKWLGTHDALVLKADRAEPLITMPLRAFAKLLGELIQAKPVDPSASEPQSTATLKPWQKGMGFIQAKLSADELMRKKLLLEQPDEDEAVPRRSSLLSQPPSEKQP